MAASRSRCRKNVALLQQLVLVGCLAAGLCLPAAGARTEPAEPMGFLLDMPGSSSSEDAASVKATGEGTIVAGDLTVAKQARDDFDEDNVQEQQPLGLLKPSLLTRKPVIGVLTHPYYGPGVHPTLVDGKLSPRAQASMIPASYVRHLQAGGAQVIPIFYDSTDAELEEAFAAMNMLLYQGGFTSLNRNYYYHKSATKLFKMALETNDKGDYFAVHGTCLGLELLATIVTQEPKSALVVETQAMGHPAALRFVSEAAKRKSIFATWPRHLVERSTRSKLTMENHKYGLVEAAMAENSRFSSFFEVLTTSVDRIGKEYISSLAAYNYPVTATQWHPEKPPYEFWSTPNVPHSKWAIEVTTAVGEFLVSEARRNSHNASREQLVSMVVDNYKFEYQAGLENHDFDAVHLFPLRAERQRKPREA